MLNILVWYLSHWFQSCLLHSSLRRSRSQRSELVEISSHAADKTSSLLEKASMYSTYTQGAKVAVVENGNDTYIYTYIHMFIYTFCGFPAIQNDILTFSNPTLFVPRIRSKLIPPFAIAVFSTDFCTHSRTIIPSGLFYQLICELFGIGYESLPVYDTVIFWAKEFQDVLQFIIWAQNLFLTTLSHWKTLHQISKCLIHNFFPIMTVASRLRAEVCTKRF